MPMPHLLRSRKIWLLLAALIGLYALAGFWLVPKLVVSGLHEYLEVKHQRHVEVGAVRFNPFTLQLDVARFAVADADGAPLVGFGHLAADVRARSVLRGGVEFALITIDQPHVRLVQRRDGSLNIMDLVPPSDPNSPMPKVWIDSLRIARGDAEFADLNRANPFQVAVTAFDFELDDFYTRSSSNVYRLTARSKLDATFAFSGTFGLDPVVSTGELHIGNFRAQSIADAGPNLLPLDVPHGTLDVNGRYDYSMRAQTAGLSLDFTDLTLHDVGLRAPGVQDTWVEIPQLTALDTHLDFPNATAKVGKLRIEGARVNAWLERSGVLNLTRLYVPLPADPAAAAAPPSKAWQLALPLVEVAGADVELADRGPRHPATLHLVPVGVTVRGITIPGSTPIEFGAEVTVNGTGHAAIDGKMTLAPLAGRLNVDFSTLPLLALQPYIEGKAALRLRSGTASFKGFAELGEGGGIVVDGDGSVDALRTTDDALEEDFVKWASVRFNGLHAATNPASLRIREVVARQPYARVIVGSNGRTNISIVLRTGSAAAPTGTPPATPPAATSNEMALEVAVVRIEGGSMNFADYSVKPQFATGIHDLSGTVRGVSSATDSRATIALDGKVDRYAPAHIAGEMNLLAATSYAKVQMSFKNLELTGMSPYAGKFAGYWIDKGKMSADLDYRIVDRKLNANHHIVVNQLTLGQHVDSPDATSLPVRLGIALLKDKDGVIDLDLPVTGSLDDPDFRIGKVVWRVVVNLVTKAVTSPFRLLGSLFGGGEDLEFVEFRAGDATLDAATRAKVAALVKALDARPGLSVDVPIGVATEFDTPALATAKFDAELSPRAAARLNADPADSGALARLRATPPAYRVMLEEAYGATVGHAPVVPPPAKGTPADAATTAAIAWLEGELRGQVSVSPRDLDALAAARAAAIQSALLDGTDIDPGRVFMIKAPPPEVAGEHLRLKLALH